MLEAVATEAVANDKAAAAAAAAAGGLEVGGRGGGGGGGGEGLVFGSRAVLMRSDPGGRVPSGITVEYPEPPIWMRHHRMTWLVSRSL